MAKNISSTDIDKVAGLVVKNAKNIQGLAKLASRKSIMTMASPGMYQYPMVVSNGIEIEYVMAIVKAFQLTFASSVATAYSLNPIMDRSVTPQLSDFVQTFHQNNPSLMAGNISGAATALGISMESATVVKNIPQQDTVLLNMNAWDDMEDCVVTESLNDMYKPYERTRRLIQERLNIIESAKANEATIFDNGEGDPNDPYGHGILAKVNTVANGKPGSNNATGLNTGGKDISVTQKWDQSANNGKGGWVDDPTKGRTVKTTSKPPFVPNFKNEVVRNNQLDSMEPTMVNVQIVAHGKSDANGGSAQSVHNLTLGIKVMPRIISSDLMIASMGEAAQNSHAIFRFLKWTKGEEKTLDFILGISASKKKALQKNAKIEMRFLEQNRKRKRLNGIGKFLNNEALPTMTIIITSYEASKIKEICGVDLTQLSEAMKLMNRYFLLSFGIYDTEQNVLQVLFDCDTDWGYTTIGALKANVSKTNDVLNQNEVLRLLGRR